MAVDIDDARSNQSIDSMQTDIKPLRLKLMPFGRDVLKPPEKKSLFSEFDSSMSSSWQEKNLQEPWWKTSHQDEKAILSEWCLLREIIWILQLHPLEHDTHEESLKQIAKFFAIDLNTDTITVNSNVSLIGTPSECLHSILCRFASTATKLYRLRKFFTTVFHKPAVNSFLESVQVAPYSIQCYANGLKDYLRVVSKAICDMEIELIEQDLTKTYTVIYLDNKLSSHLQKVHMLYDMHTRVYIDFKTNAGTFSNISNLLLLLVIILKKFLQDMFV